HTELMLRHFGAAVISEPNGPHGRKITLHGQPELSGTAVSVPADPSSAAFPMVAALIAPGSDLILTAVMMNPLRTGLIPTLREMGRPMEGPRHTPGRGRADGGFARAQLAAARHRGAGAARTHDDRRISGARRGGRLRGRHHGDARPEGTAREGIRPTRRDRRH